MVDNKEKKIKPKINITIKDPSRKQVIIPISTNNSEAIISHANEYIININCLLKGVKSKISANFICSNNKEVIITTNKAAIVSDLTAHHNKLNKINKESLLNINTVLTISNASVKNKVATSIFHV